MIKVIISILIMCAGAIPALHRAVATDQYLTFVDLASFVIGWLVGCALLEVSGDGFKKIE